MKNRDELKALLDDDVITQSEYDELNKRILNKKSKREKLRIPNILKLIIIAIIINIIFSIVRRLWKIYKFYKDLPDILKVFR
ncbi:hypothetical protein SAMN05216349_108129 [Oribacterium sp. KHPX15]|uniref:hypothetical protein n=1 Tax=Oribacterium sp. KHPX15 TaxID=1855342 RepID=UPI00089B2D2D|nr:hypothetical protein [Oribacterium sp. KHPX15]SEA29398.1 hypothetical protein SAMN05216349_108129 [Oribacterium sp. KHPX15]